MLSLDENKLRWLGIDMRPRWRRRVAVVATYAAFLVVVWVHPRWAYGALELLWVAWFISLMWSAVAEVEWVMRVTFTALWVLIVGVQMWQSHGKVSAVTTALYATFLMAFASVLSCAGMAALTDSGWLAQAIEKGEELSWRQQRRLARMGFAVGRDGFAWYEFGVRFRRLNAEQRGEVEGIEPADPGQEIAGQAGPALLVPEGVGEDETRQHEEKIDQHQPVTIKGQHQVRQRRRPEMIRIVPADDPQRGQGSQAVQFMKSAQCSHCGAGQARAGLGRQVIWSRARASARSSPNPEPLRITGTRAGSSLREG